MGLRQMIKGVWRKLHNAEVHALYTSPNLIKNLKSRRLRWEEYVACMELHTNTPRVLVGWPEGKRPSGRSRSRQEDNNKMELRGGQ